ncbi:zinc-dependent metalloprotease [Lacibacter sediminis]|uniref:Zinc-dependent metalloprotease n=2 Tax=Lacibacter sediminis TaxID=2760713 RepID=A0A7G5XMG7_9BACT|nr:zinc-dependent metalloprotease [Lacibacter sediminis]
MKNVTLASLLLAGSLTAGLAQNRPTVPASGGAPTQLPTGAPPMAQRAAMPKPYKEVITDKAKTDEGLFKVHMVDDKWYFELPDSLLNRDILVVTRISKSAAGLSNGFSGYAGDIVNNNVIRFEKGPNNRVFLRRVSFDQRGTDENGMYKAVVNSNIQPIMQTFSVSAFGRDSVTNTRSTVIDMTEFVAGDNDVLFFSTGSKSSLQLGAVQADKSYINTIKSYPINIEVKTVKTYTRGGAAPGAQANPFSAQGRSGNFTLELNSSMLLLPKVPAKPRYFDPRVGFFTRRYTDFDANPQGVKEIEMAVRWKLEPKDEDIEKYKRGELVEPKNPIIYYIDPATPKKWVNYLIQGVNDWQAAFEKAGFKNAIMGKMAPTPQEDSTWSLEDARFSAIVYKPSEVANASGPNVHDPRSGQILESHINWYHNVMSLLRNWYFIQTAAVDPGSRTMVFEDALMGELIRFVSSHEVGHTLGLRHNYGSSSTVPVDSLRNKKWVEANGHTPSIMDYARFNYVAQPEDNITRIGLFPRIGDYDKWAIEWGYRWMPEYKTAEAEVPVLQKLTTERLKNKRNWFGTETNPDDPRSQNEDLGNDAMKASGYGIKNLQRIVPNLINWTKQPNESYEGLDEMYNQVQTQFGRYMGHVAKNIGGIYETPKMSEQDGAVYEFTPKSVQKEAMSFLNQQLFTTPTWLINNDIFSRTGISPQVVIANRQESILNRIISSSTMTKLFEAEAAIGNNAYKATEVMDDLRRAIFSEVYAKKATDVYRRNLQKMFVERIITLLPGGASPLSIGGLGITLQISPSLNIKNTDAYSILKGTLRTLRNDIKAALPLTTDNMTKLHLQDLSDRITDVLENK